jgi:hypothetical protein
VSVEAADAAPMLDPFRGMLAELHDRGLTGADVDACAAALATMEAHLETSADLASFGAALADSGLYLEFSDAYTRAATAAATAAAAPSADANDVGAAPSDEELLANTLAAYEGAIEPLRSTPDGDLAIEAIEAVLALGRSGISYPVFLRRLEEAGLARALEGAVVTRRALERELDLAREQRNPVAVAAAEDRLSAYDRLAEQSPFGVPDAFRFGLWRDRVDWEHEPALITRRLLQWRWYLLVSSLVDWLDAHTTFAPTDDRWAGPGASPADVQRNIARTKACEPGIFRARERIVRESFGHDFPALMAHELVANDVALGTVGWTDERLALAVDTYEHCRPGATAPGELVARSEALRSSGREMRSVSRR